MSVCRRPLAITAFAVGVAGGASAHDDRLTAHWCHLGTIEVAGEFRVEPPALIAFTNSNPCPKPIGRDCGQFDDDYFAARSYSSAYCAHIYQAYASQPGVHGIMPLVTEPENFLSTDEHHSYDMSQGLEGVCLVCRMGTPAPSDPDPTH